MAEMVVIAPQDLFFRLWQLELVVVVALLQAVDFYIWH